MRFMKPVFIMLIICLNVIGCSQATSRKSASLSGGTPGVIKIIAPEGRQTLIETQSTVPFRWNTLGQGAVQGMEACTRMRVEGGPEALLGFLVCLPVSAMAGAFTRIISEPAPQPVNIDDIAGFFAHGQAQLLAHHYASQQLRQLGGRVVLDSPASVNQLSVTELNQSARQNPRAEYLHDDTPVNVNHYFEIWVKKITLNVSSEPTADLVTIKAELQGRFMAEQSLQDYQTIAIELESEPRRKTAWNGDDRVLLHDLLQRAVKQLIDQTVLSI